MDLLAVCERMFVLIMHYGCLVNDLTHDMQYKYVNGQINSYHDIVKPL